MRQILLESGTRLDYDFVSFNIGSEPDVSKLEVDRGNVWMVKPISNIARLREHLTGALADGRASAIVIGGGATGCEVAASLAESARRAERIADVLLTSRSPRLMRDQRQSVSRCIQRALVRRGIRLHMDCAVERVDESTVHCADGSAHRADTIVVATGLRAPALLAQFGLSRSRPGLRVDATRRCAALMIAACLGRVTALIVMGATCLNLGCSACDKRLCCWRTSARPFRARP